MKTAGNGGEARLARRGAAPLAGDDVDEARRRVLPADDGLDDPHLPDGGGQLLEGHGVHVLAGLRGVGLKLGQGHLVELILFVGRHDQFLLSEMKEKPVEDAAGQRRAFALHCDPDSGIHFSPQGARRQNEERVRVGNSD